MPVDVSPCYNAALSPETPLKKLLKLVLVLGALAGLIYGVWGSGYSNKILRRQVDQILRRAQQSKLTLKEPREREMVLRLLGSLRQSGDLRSILAIIDN